MDTQEGRAVIGGLACRLPKSKNCQEFWENLMNGRDLISATRWPRGVYDLPPRIGAIGDVDKFDNIFFNISDNEANHLNPMLRHLLEVTYECIVDSCLPLQKLQQTKTGLYLAVFGSDTDFLETSRCFNKDHVSNSPYLAGELMKSLGITGPSVTVDTACSSSMAALNMAVNDLNSGRCSYAIVASCNLILNPLFSQQMFVLQMLCKEGKSRVFDKDAAGYVRAEGFSALLIAREAESLPRVYVKIVDIGINCDGYKAKGITNPDSESQARLMRKLYRRSKLDVNDVAYVEAHGTGTQAGDKAETAAILDVFCQNRTEPLLIGSVKSNMGHSEATAALASIVKGILALHHKELPGNLNYQTPNPEIQGLAEGKLKVVDKPTKLNSKYLGINSFGFGGVNGHIIIEPFVDTNQEEFVNVPGHLIVPLTTRNHEGVHSIVEFVSNNRYNTNLLGILSSSLLSCDTKQPYRGFIQVGPKEEDFSVHCQVWDEDVPSVYLCLEDFVASKISVSGDMMEINTFTVALKKCSQSITLLEPSLDILSLLKSGEPILSITRAGMLAATAILISIVDCLEESLCPFDGVVGCGLSEVVGAYIDGCLSLDQCFNIVSKVGNAVEEFAQLAVDRWQIYEVKLDVEQVYQLGPRVQVLAIYDREHVTVSIETIHKEKVLARIHAKGGFYNLVPSNVPLYSGLMTDVSKKIKQELRDVIPAPVYRSSHLLSAQCEMSRKPSLAQCLYDADYISKIISRPVNLHAVIKHLPEDTQLVKLFPTSSAGLHFRFQAACDVDVSIMSENQSVCSEQQPRIKQGLRYNSLSAQSGLDETEDEGDYVLVKTRYPIVCMSTAQSFCHTLGEMHILGFHVDVGMLFPPRQSTLGIETPSVSPLVRWDHSRAWNIPEWMEFSCRVKDEHFPYMVEEECEDEEEGIHSPLAVLLYHTWKAVSEKLHDVQDFRMTEDLLPVQLVNLVTVDDSFLRSEALIGTTIHVLTGTKTFAAISDDQVLVKGNFEVGDSFHLPSIPGYDLDINDNVQLSPKDSDVQFERTEIQWEDSWLDFINDALEFANQYMDAPLQGITIDSVYHHKEAKECPNFLAVVEKNTGICRSGGCVLQFSLPLIPDVPDFNWSQMTVDNPNKTSVSKVMVYSLYSNQNIPDKVIIYQADKSIEGRNYPVLGLVNMNDEKMMQELPLSGDWKSEDLEVFVPYLLASHILYDVTHAKEQQTVLVLPPIDTVGVYIIALASQLGCSVFTSTYDVENLQCLEATFPHIRVLHGDKLDENIMMLTQARGVDICIKLSGGDVNSSMEYVSQNGHLIQCIPPPRGEPIGVQVLSKNRTLSILKPLAAFRQFKEKSSEDLQALLFNMKDEVISKLSTEGFPESKGILYNQENVSVLLQPIALDRLMSLILEPSLGVVMDDLLEADIICVENIQNLVAPKPKDYSLTDTSVMRNPVQQTSEEPLNLGMMMTPTLQKQNSSCMPSVYSPEVNVISFTETNTDLKQSPVDTGKKPKGKKNFPPTSTPMMHGNHEANTTKQLEESYLENQKDKSSSPPINSDSFTVFSDSLKRKTSKSQKEDEKSKTSRKERSESEKEKKGKDDFDGKVIKTLVADSAAKKGSKKTTLPGTPKTKKGPSALPTILLTDSESHSRRLSGIDTPGYERPGTPIVKTAIRSETFQHLMQKKAKPVPPQLKLIKPKVDLLQLCPPMTPMSPALKQILTPRMVSNLVPLNKLAQSKERPLYIVHPITGVTRLLEPLGEELMVPCYGIQRTPCTPSDSINNVASYYRNSIEMMQSSGPYRICGYSFGAMIALEIALQLQDEGKQVEKLILLDGSPGYIHSQINHAMKRISTSSTKEELEEAIVIGALINWITFYGPVRHKDLTYGMLRKLPTMEQRLDIAVDLTFGYAVVSPNPNQTKWLTAKQLLLKKTKTVGAKKEQFADAAKEIIRLKRRDKARDFIAHVLMGKSYKAASKFEGDIYLHRVKDGPIFESTGELRTDYGLQSQCSGQVHMKFYEGDHESFLTKDALAPLTRDIHQVLGVK